MVEATAAIFILLFVYTAISKLSDLHLFFLILSRSPLLAPFARPAAVGIPVSELLLAALLFFPATRLYGLLASGCLMVVFTGYIVCMLLYSPELPCSCGGVIGELGWKGHLVLNSVLAVLAFRGWALYEKSPFAGRWNGGPI